MNSQGIVHKICQVYGDHEDERKDLFQEILVQLWRSYPSFRGEARFTTWMYQVAFNVAIQHLRKRNGGRIQKALPRSTRIAKYKVQAKIRWKTEKKVSEKPSDSLKTQRKQIILLHLEEKSHAEIAEIIGITENHVGVKINRIKSKLKKILDTIHHE